MQRITKTSEVYAHNINDIIKKLNYKISKGWQPLGSIVYTRTEYWEYHMLIVKYEQPTIEPTIKDLINEANN